MYHQNVSSWSSDLLSPKSSTGQGLVYAVTDFVVLSQAFYYIARDTTCNEQYGLGQNLHLFFTKCGMVMCMQILHDAI